MTPALTKNLKYTDYIQNYYLLTRFIRKITGFRLIKEYEREEIINFTNLINNEFSVDLSKDKIINTIENQILKYMIYYKVFYKIINKINPKIIIQVISYDFTRFVINDIANIKGIPTIELQHGIMGKNHIAYNFSDKRFVSTFPQYIFLFGEYWKEGARFPISNEQIKVVGWPYYEEKLVKYDKNSKMKNNEKRLKILFLSQGTIGKQLSLFAKQLCKDSQDKYKIIYKLHPGEYSRWKVEYPWLIDKNIEIVDNNSVDIHFLFSQADVQVGVYSTAIYEGLGYGLRTIIVKLFGYENLLDLIYSNYAHLVNSTEDIIEYLDKLTQEPKLDTAYFWKKNSLNNIKYEIEEIINRTYSEKVKNNEQTNE
jgi:hypothetical protein